MAEQFTKGPWEIQSSDDEGEYRGSVVIIGANLGGLVGAALPWPTELDSGDFSRVKANARLMVSAPDMFEALKLVEPILGRGPVTLETIEAYKAVADAIARANGMLSRAIGTSTGG